MDLIAVVPPTAPDRVISPPVPAVTTKSVEPAVLSSTVPDIEIEAPTGTPPPFVVSSVMLEGDPAVPKITLSVIVIVVPAVTIFAFNVVVEPGPIK